MAEYISKAILLDNLDIENALGGHYGISLTEINKLPAVDVRPVVRGEWGYRWKIHGDGRRPTELYPCLECGYENTSATHFCPNCGADMREE